MAYSKQTWDTTSYVNPTRMNHIEEGIYDASTNIADNLTTDDSTKALSAKQGKVLNDTKANTTDVAKMDKSALIFNQLGLSTTETAYNCNWQNYKYLIICACRYDNIISTYFLPKSYFESTNIGARVLCRDIVYDKAYNVRHNGNGSIYITASVTDSTCGIKIWGVDEI